MAGIALLFNPILLIHFHRAEWAWIDAVAAVVFFGLSSRPETPEG